MAAKDYIWDSQAAAQIEAQELNEHYENNEAHYKNLAEEVWNSLTAVSPAASLLKHGDLWDALLPILTRDATTLDALEEADLPLPMARGGLRWIAWFTHYVAERYLDSLETEEEENDE